MSQTLLIFFFIALGVLAVVVGRRIVLVMKHSYSIDPNMPSVFAVDHIAQGARNMIAWVPQVIRLTLVNIAQGLGMAARGLARRFEKYRH